MNITVPTLSFNIEGMTSSEVADILATKGFATRAGLHCAPMAHRRLGTIDSGTVRVCSSAFSTANEADAFINAVKSIVKV